jgi:hypothetical protein
MTKKLTQAYRISEVFADSPIERVEATAGGHYLRSFLGLDEGLCARGVNSGLDDGSN